MHFCPHFPHLLSDFGKILYKKSAHNVLSICEFLVNRHRKGITVSIGKGKGKKIPLQVWTDP
jgi:hypothetical protein